MPRLMTPTLASTIRTADKARQTNKELDYTARIGATDDTPEGVLIRQMLFLILQGGHDGWELHRKRRLNDWDNASYWQRVKWIFTPPDVRSYDD